MDMIFRQRRVLDGAMGTRLMELGWDYVKNPLWSAQALLKNPEKVVQVHKEYLDAGATIIETNTYQACLDNLKAHENLSDEKAVQTVHMAVRLARTAIDEYGLEHRNNMTDKYFVVGSVGPFATMLYDGSEYDGLYIKHFHPDVIRSYYKKQLDALMSSGVDCIALETIPSLQEALLAVEVLSSFPAFPAWLSFSCKDGCCTNFGDPFLKAAKEICRYPCISALGINCTNRCNVLELLQQTVHNMKPIVVYPNGIKKNVREAETELRPLGAYVKDWVQYGATVIGGCCFTAPCDIKTVSEAFSELG